MMTNKIDTVIFDLDGTLLDTLGDLADSVNYALGRFDMPPKSDAQVKSYVGNGIRNLMRRAVPGGEDNPLFEKAFGAFKEYYNDHCNVRTKAYDGILELIRELKDKGYHIAIVSNKVDSAVKNLRNDYFENIEVAIGDREGMRIKPAPDSVNLALEELGKTSKSAIYVGDSDVDIETARNSGLPCISVLWGFRDKEFLVNHGAEIFANKPSDILYLLEKKFNDNEAI
jgi:phosphoglycolate phosphatase